MCLLHGSNMYYTHYCSNKNFLMLNVSNVKTLIDKPPGNNIGETSDNNIGETSDNNIDDRSDKTRKVSWAQIVKG